MPGLKPLGSKVLNHLLVTSRPCGWMRGRQRTPQLQSDLHRRTVLLHLRQGSLASEAIKFIHASQFNYASVMSFEIPQKKTYGVASQEASLLLHHSFKNVGILIDINQILFPPHKGLMGK